MKEDFIKLFKHLFRGTYSLVELVVDLYAIVYLWELHLNISIIFIVLLSISALYASYKIGKGELKKI